jgi:NADPH2:quinone reductase
MKAASYTRNGAAREVLEYGTLPDPEPAAHEMRVKVAFSGINPSDVKRRSGASNVLAFDRAIPNMDGSGIVDRVGDAVDRDWIGKRVWLHKTGWERPYGTAAEYAISAPDRAFELPSVVSFEAGAALGVPAMTAHRALFCDGPLDGKTVLVTGGAGLVGFYAIQLAKWAGAARVISTVSSAQKADLAKLAGAHTIVNYRTENTVEAVLQATGGKGVDHIVEVDFGANLADTLRLIAPYGVVSAYASAAVPNPAIPFRELMAKNVKLVPFLVYSMAPDAIAAAGRDVNAWLAAGKARHNIAKRFSLEQLADAHLAVEAGEVGKVVVEVAGENLAL